MLDPKKDRFDYKEILKAPPNYHFNFAITTTYSLDLEALMEVLIALGLDEEIESNLTKHEFYSLSSIMNMMENIAIFCDASKIHFKDISKKNIFLSLFDGIITPIKTKFNKKYNKYPAFHPKMWVVRYVSKTDFSDIKYRVIILSKNLTFDRSYDTAFILEGEYKKVIKTKKVNREKNKPLKDFLIYLKKRQDEYNKNQNSFKKIIDELDNVVFTLQDKEFEDFEFLPNQIVNIGSNGKYNIEDDELFRENFHELLIISPFLSKGIIKNFYERSKELNNTRCLVVTKDMSLNKIPREVMEDFDVYIMKDEVIGGENNISEEENNFPKKQDIHAKVFMMRKGARSKLYIGSLNATESAKNLNIEFMIKLYAPNRYVNLEKLSNDLFCGNDENKSPFKKVYSEELIDLSDEDNTENDSELEDIKNYIIRNAYSKVVKTKDSYNFEIKIDGIKSYIKKYDISLTLLTLTNYKKVEKEKIIFENLKMYDLTSFLNIKIGNDVKFTIQIEVFGMPENEVRFHETTKKYFIDNEDKVYSYIKFALDETSVERQKHIYLEESAFNADDENFVDNNNLPYDKNHQKHISYQSGIYEKMLKASATSYDKIYNLNEIIENLEDERYSDLKKFFKTFYNAV